MSHVKCIGVHRLYDIRSLVLFKYSLCVLYSHQLLLGELKVLDDSATWRTPEVGLTPCLSLHWVVKPGHEETEGTGH